MERTAIASRSSGYLIWRQRKSSIGASFLAVPALNFGMTADGSKLMIYNAGFEIELYDAKSLELLKTINLEGDTTSNLVVMPLPSKST